MNVAFNELFCKEYFSIHFIPQDRNPRDDDDDEDDDRRLVINHSGSSQSPTISGMTSSHPSSGVPSPSIAPAAAVAAATAASGSLTPAAAVAAATGHSDEGSGGENSSGVHDVNRHISSPDSDPDHADDDDSGREDSA